MNKRTMTHHDGVWVFTEGAQGHVTGFDGEPCDPAKWLVDNWTDFLQMDEDLDILVYGRCDVKLYIDWSEFEAAAQPDTTYYGGTVKIAEEQGDEILFEELQGWGDDRSDNILNCSVLDRITDAISLAARLRTGISIIQTRFPGKEVAWERSQVGPEYVELAAEKWLSDEGLPHDLGHITSLARLLERVAKSMRERAAKLTDQEPYLCPIVPDQNVQIRVCTKLGQIIRTINPREV